MSFQPETNDEPLIPMPPLIEQALRIAVRTLVLAAAVRFESEFHAVSTPTT